MKKKEQNSSFISTSEIDKAARKWLDKNDWSVNDDTAGDNYGSFRAGIEFAVDYLNKKNGHFECKDIIKEIKKFK